MTADLERSKWDRRSFLEAGATTAAISALGGLPGVRQLFAPLPDLT